MRVMWRSLASRGGEDAAARWYSPMRAGAPGEEAGLEPSRGEGRGAAARGVIESTRQGRSRVRVTWRPSRAGNIARTRDVGADQDRKDRAYA